MRSRTLSVSERFRRMWVMVPQMAGSGLPRRLRLALLAVRPGDRHLNYRATGGLVLLDSNENKIPHAEREFGESCERLNPLEVPLRLFPRLFLIGSLVLPGRLHQVVAVLAVASNIKRRLRQGIRFALYNPYHLLQYAIADCIAIEKVFHLAPEYPRFPNVQQAIACSAAHEILGYSPLQRVLTIQPHSVVEDHAVVRVYLTQIQGLRTRREEAALIEFARWVRGRVNVPVEIFLHYLDREIDESDPKARSLLQEFGTSVRRDASLHSLSSRQVSVSGFSSIGYDLLSSDICHVMVVDEAREGTSRAGAAGLQLSKWWATRRDVINFDAPYLQWLEALASSDPECFETVFRRSPSEIEQLVGSETETD